MRIWTNIKDWLLRKKVNVQEMRRATRRNKLHKHVLGNNKELLSPTIISPENTERTNRYRYNLVKELRNAIDSNKADKIELDKYLLIDDYVSDVTGGFDSSVLLKSVYPIGSIYIYLYPI